MKGGENQLKSRQERQQQQERREREQRQERAAASEQRQKNSVLQNGSNGAVPSPPRSSAQPSAAASRPPLEAQISAPAGKYQRCKAQICNIYILCWAEFIQNTEENLLVDVHCLCNPHQLMVDTDVEVQGSPHPRVASQLLVVPPLPAAVHWGQVLRGRPLFCKNGLF